MKNNDTFIYGTALDLLWLLVKSCSVEPANVEKVSSIWNVPEIQLYLGHQLFILWISRLIYKEVLWDFLWGIIAATGDTKCRYTIRIQLWQSKYMQAGRFQRECRSTVRYHFCDVLWCHARVMHPAYTYDHFIFKTLKFCGFQGKHTYFEIHWGSFFELVFIMSKNLIIPKDIRIIGVWRMSSPLWLVVNCLKKFWQNPICLSIKR